MIETDPAAPTFSFPRSARLRQPPEFQAAFAEGGRLHGDCFRLHVRPLPSGRARLGVSVSRRVDLRAVVRNRIKRLARDVFRHAAPRLAPGDYVLVAKREAALAVRAGNAAAVRKELRRLFARCPSLKPGEAGGTMPASTPDAADAPAPPCSDS